MDERKNGKCSSHLYLNFHLQIIFNIIYYMNPLRVNGIKTSFESIHKPSFITGFHIHPHHSTDYLHMHVICNNKNMKTKKKKNSVNVFDIHTSSEKFIKTKDMLSYLKVNYKNMKNLNENKSSSKYFNNIFKKQVEFNNLEIQNAANNKYNNLLFSNLNETHINKIIRKDSTILHMDEKCVVFSNVDVVTRKMRNGIEVDGQSCSKIHLLVIPWMPIYNCVQFEEHDESHIDLIKHMHKMGVMCGKGIASKYKNIGEKQELSIYNYNMNRAFEVLRQGRVLYLQRLKSTNTNNRTTRIKKLNKMTNNRNINKNNFHDFTMFSSEKNGKIAKMKQWRTNHKGK